MRKSHATPLAFLGLFSLIALGGVATSPQLEPDNTSVKLIHQMFEQRIAAITPSLLDDAVVIEIDPNKHCINTTDFPSLDALFKQST